MAKWTTGCPPGCLFVRRTRNRTGKPAREPNTLLHVGRHKKKWKLSPPLLKSSPSKRDASQSGWSPHIEPSLVTTTQLWKDTSSRHCLWPRVCAAGDLGRAPHQQRRDPQEQRDAEVPLGALVVLPSTLLCYDSLNSLSSLSLFIKQGEIQV